MKKRLMVGMFAFAILFIGGLLVADSSGSDVPKSAPQEIKEVFKSVVKIRVTFIWRGDLEKEEWGSGFFVAPGYVLTAPHIASQFQQVIDDPRTKIKIVLDERLYSAEVVAIDWTKELMLLKVINAPQVPIVKLAWDIEEDETVFVTGYIYKFVKDRREPFCAVGMVESIDDKTTAKEFGLPRMAMALYGVTKLLTINGRSEEEVSGGPVFNVNGEVVGLSWLMSEGYVFATPVDVIKEFLEKHLEGYKDEQ